MKRKRLITDLMFLTKQIFTFFKLIGLATIRIHIKSNKKYEKMIYFTRSYTGKLYNVTLVFLLVILNYFMIKITIEFFDIIKKRIFEKAIDMVQITFTAVSAIIILLKFCIQQKKVLKMVNAITTLRQTLLKINYKLYSSDTLILSNLSKVFVSNFTTWILIICVSDIHHNYVAVIYYIANYFNGMIINFTIIQYSMMLTITEKLFTVVNNNFLSISKQFNYIDNIGAVHNLFNVDFYQIESDKLTTLHNLHISLCEISEEISEFYALPILLSITNMFIALLVYLYHSTKPIVFGLITLDYFSEYSYYIAHIIHITVLFIILAKSTAGVIVEVRIY